MIQTTDFVTCLTSDFSMPAKKESILIMLAVALLVNTYIAAGNKVQGSAGLSAGQSHIHLRIRCKVLGQASILLPIVLQSFTKFMARHIHVCDCIWENSTCGYFHETGARLLAVLPN